MMIGAYVVPNLTAYEAFSYYTSPLVEAVKKRDTGLIEIHLSEMTKSQQANKLKKLDFSSQLDSDGNCPLYWAIEMEDEKCSLVKIFEQFNTDFNKLYINKTKTPLMHAAEIGRCDIVVFLLKKGVFLNVKNIDDNVVLFFAIDSGFKEIIDLILNEILSRALVYYKDKEADFFLFNNELFRNIVFDIAGVDQWMQKDGVKKNVLEKTVLALKQFFQGPLISARFSSSGVLERQIIEPIVSGLLYSLYLKASSKLSLELTQIILEYSLNSFLPAFQNSIAKIHQINLRQDFQHRRFEDKPSVQLQKCATL